MKNYEQAVTEILTTLSECDVRVSSIRKILFRVIFSQVSQQRRS